MFQQLKEKLILENPDTVTGTIQKFIVNEEYLILKYMQRFLSYSIKDEIKKKYNHQKIKILMQKKDCLYNTNPHFKNKVNRLLDMFGHNPTNSKDERVNF